MSNVELDKLLHNLDRPEWKRIDLIAAAAAVIREFREDKTRLDWLDTNSRGYGQGWICRDSMTGRGLRLHETSRLEAEPTVRKAIDAARKAEQTKEPV